MYSEFAANKLPHTLPAATRVTVRLAWAWTISGAAVLYWLFRNRGFDDPFITYRYAVNLADGNGFVYNLGERIQSSTTPLYTLLLAALHLVGADVPTASVIVGCASIALGGLVLWQLSSMWHTEIAGIAALLLYPTFPLLLPTLGAETALYSLLIISGILAYAREQYLGVALLLALAALTRADGILAAAVVGGHFVIMRRKAIPLGAIGLYFALVGAWFAFAWVYFGSPLPVTLATKQHQGTMRISTSFLRGLGMQVADYWNLWEYRPLFALALLGLVYAFVKRRAWLLLLGWATLYCVAYTALGVTNYFWYYGPLAPAVIGLVALGIEATTAVVTRSAGRRLARGLAAALIVVATLVNSWHIVNFSRSNDSRMKIYREVGTWLQGHTSPEASVGTLEVGIIGFYAQRRMIDFAGLIQPATAQEIASTTTYQDTALWSIRQYHPNYLVLQAAAFPQIEADPAVAARCREVVRFHDPAYSFPISVQYCSW